MTRKICLLFLLPLAACVSSGVPPTTSEIAGLTLPAAWSGGMRVGSATDALPSATVPQTDLAVWWQRFQDPQLNQLITQSLLANTSVQSAQAALRQARALRDVSAAALTPKINASASGQRSKAGDIAPANSFSTGFDASWEPDIFGANHQALAASEATARASAASLGDVQISVAAEVALNYIQLRTTQVRLAIARANVASQAETLQITNWRVQAGLLTSLEAEQGRAASEQAQAQIPLLETTEAQNLHSLEVLCGQTPESLRQQLQSRAADTGSMLNVSGIPQADDNLALSLPAETLRQRPDIRAAEHQINAALARVRQADVANYPSFNLSGSLGLRALTVGALGGSGTLLSSVLASVSLPVLDGGANRAQLQAQQAALEQAQLAYKAAVLTALQDVENALVALKNDRARLQGLRNAADAASNAALLARQRFASGLVDFQTILETQRTLYSAQDAVASTSNDLAADYVRLYKALGGGWQADQDDSAGMPGALNQRDN
ncbi:efflux transporter outer membrane subunit [Undibacterium sp. FT147W]|uniref:Efflux transporter outer membrane subunit n=1 Tax=Undibacterium rivi TaxID=2828729 RepID=A0ABS5H313_9BURK|nr:efflux transporter outer membrane subunit [Undibacterium rivi]MBR7793008.1 efflux transporter outer membrane subunit [Undibacterium rivi]